MNDRALICFGVAIAIAAIFKGRGKAFALIPLVAGAFVWSTSIRPSAYLASNGEIYVSSVDGWLGWRGWQQYEALSPLAFNSRPSKAECNALEPCLIRGDQMSVTISTEGDTGGGEAGLKTKVSPPTACAPVGSMRFETSAQSTFIQIDQCILDRRLMGAVYIRNGVPKIVWTKSAQGRLWNLAQPEG